MASSEHSHNNEQDPSARFEMIIGDVFEKYSAYIKKGDDDVFSLAPIGSEYLELKPLAEINVDNVLVDIRPDILSMTLFRPVQETNSRVPAPLNSDPLIGGYRLSIAYADATGENTHAIYSTDGVDVMKRAQFTVGRSPSLEDGRRIAEMLEQRLKLAEEIRAMDGLRKAIAIRQQKGVVIADSELRDLADILAFSTPLKAHSGDLVQQTRV